MTRYTTRSGMTAIVLGPGPLTKTFLVVNVLHRRYLVWAKTLRYRMDNNKDGTPVLDSLDLIPAED